MLDVPCGTLFSLPGLMHQSVSHTTRDTVFDTHRPTVNTDQANSVSKYAILRLTDKMLGFKRQINNYLRETINTIHAAIQVT